MPLSDRPSRGERPNPFETESMRDTGEEIPQGLLARLIYALTRRRFGRVLRPVKLHGRSPDRLLGFALMTTIQTRSGALDQRLSLLGQARVAGLVGCPF